MTDSRVEATERVEALLTHVAKVLEGFDAAVFVRDVSGDAALGWSLKLLPYVRALAELREAVVAGAPPLSTEPASEEIDKRTGEPVCAHGVPWTACCSGCARDAGSLSQGALEPSEAAITAAEKLARGDEPLSWREAMRARLRAAYAVDFGPALSRGPGPTAPDKRKCAHRGGLFTPGIETGCMECAVELGRQIAFCELGYTVEHEEAMRRARGAASPAGEREP